jgi:hypothetical protein
LSYAIVVNAVLVDTCNLYDVAPADAFQTSVGGTTIFIDPLAGEDSVGTVGTVTVVNDHTEDQSLNPPP